MFLNILSAIFLICGFTLCVGLQFEWSEADLSEPAAPVVAALEASAETVVRELSFAFTAFAVDDGGDCEDVGIVKLLLLLSRCSCCSLTANL